jgi:hypothetical protein
MLTPDKQTEIAKRSMDAAFGYTQAAINAAFEINARAFSVWSQVAQTALPKAVPEAGNWEWSGAPKRPHSTLLTAEQQHRRPRTPFAAWSELMQASGRVWFKGAPSPFAWWAWTPQSAVPATWPWAYGMISSGVPDSVAWPMAEANVALIDAATKTAEAARPVFPTYQSANGFAGHVWIGSAAAKSIMATLPAAAFMWPWLEKAA